MKIDTSIRSLQILKTLSDINHGGWGNYRFLAFILKLVLALLTDFWERSLIHVKLEFLGYIDGNLSLIIVNLQIVK